MQFYVVPYSKKNISGIISEYPYVVLRHDAWNDYGYETLYIAHLHISTTIMKTLGAVKIMSLSQETDLATKLSTEFETLSDNYCSLGQSLEYYRILSEKSLYQTVGKIILQSLGDVAVDPERYKRFKKLEAFKKSLLRSSEATKAFKIGGGIVNGEIQTIESFDFTFTCRLVGASDPHRLHVQYAQIAETPFRLNVLIGRNGTGKTGVLSQLAIALTDSTYTTGKFSARPMVSRVVALSFNAFDDFPLPIADNEHCSYVYCGLRTQTRLLFSIPVDNSFELNNGKWPDLLTKNLNEHFHTTSAVPLEMPNSPWKVDNILYSQIWQLTYSNLRQEKIKVIKRDNNLYAYGYCLMDVIEQLNRVNEWIEKCGRKSIDEGAIANLSHELTGNRNGSSSDVLKALILKIPDLPDNTCVDPIKGRSLSFHDWEIGKEAFGRMSAGQRFFVQSVVGLFTNLEPDSIVLIDEPENHLHPGMLSTYLSLLTNLLDAFNSFALVATHSAVVLQQVPSQNVRVFKRIENYPIIDPPNFECFGENLQTITEKCLGLAEPELDYHLILDKLLSTKTPEEIEALFNNRLSLNSRIYLRSKTNEGRVI